MGTRAGHWMLIQIPILQLLQIIQIQYLYITLSGFNFGTTFEVSGIVIMMAIIL